MDNESAVRIRWVRNVRPAGGCAQSDVARQIYGFMSAENPDEVQYSVRGKLEGGLFGTRRFRDAGTFTLAPRAASVPD